jgi:hypothetical protein
MIAKTLFCTGHHDPGMNVVVKSELGYNLWRAKAKPTLGMVGFFKWYAGCDMVETKFVW